MLYARGRSGSLRVMLPAGRECSIPICGRIKAGPFLKNVSENTDLLVALRLRL